MLSYVDFTWAGLFHLLMKLFVWLSRQEKCLLGHKPLECTHQLA